MAKKQKGTFGVKVSGGSAAGFSNIPGASSYTVSLGKQFAKKFGEGVKSVKPVKPKGQVIEDPAPDTVKPDTDGEPTPPKKVKERKATTADVEAAVAGGFITPEEATGGEWGKDAGLSTTYSKKYAANTAANDGVAKGKKFTGPKGSQGRETAAIWDTPSTPSQETGYATPRGNYAGIGSAMDKPAPEQKPSDGSYLIAPGPSAGMLSRESAQLSKSKGNANRGKQFP